MPRNYQQFLDETLVLAGGTEHFQYTLYNHPEHILFSKSPSFRYVLDYGSWTKPVGKLKDTFAKLKEAPIFETLSDDTRGEFLRRESAASTEIPNILERVGRAREKIYASMVKCYNEKSK